MIIKQIVVVIISISLSLISLSSYAKSFTSLKVIKTAHSHSCLDFHIIPNPCVYMYLSCSLFGGCGIKFAFRDRIRHKLPDLVVSSFRKPGQTPYLEIRKTASIVAKKVMDTTLTKFFDDHGFDGAEHENALVNLGAIQTKNNLRFNEANVIGSPAAPVIRQTMKYLVPFIMGGPFLCKSSTKPLLPYHMSELDAVAWRKAELNLLDTLTTFPLSREIGSLSDSNLFGNTWGGVIPRVGFIHQTTPVKAAAVASVRAVDIVSKTYQFPHVYVPYGYSGPRTVSEATASNCSDGFGVMRRDQYCVESLPNTPDWEDMTNAEKQAEENNQCPMQCFNPNSFVQRMIEQDEHSAAWQMITPKESSSCIAFGSADPKWGDDKNAEDGDYAWNYWRQYQCCKPGPGILLNP